MALCELGIYVPATIMLFRLSRQPHMVMAREMPRLSQMKGVLAPFPLPGAPFSHTTSSGACNFCRMQSSITASMGSVQTPVLVNMQCIRMLNKLPIMG